MNKGTWADLLLKFYKNLHPPENLPDKIVWLYPQKDPVVIQIVEQFLQKFYNDKDPRTLFLGINPGRFGAGVTGVNFTAPKQLKEFCGIDHPFRKLSELSAEFIYEMIHAYGGPNVFYRKFFIGSVCPLGFVKEGKNLNYYDHPELLRTVEPFIIESIRRQLELNVSREKCLCIGGEKNFKYLGLLNKKFGWFEKLVPLPHPRFIMQYRRKQMKEFIGRYLEAME